MQPVQGNVQPRGMRVDFDKVGPLENVRTNIYKMPVNEKKTLKFALKGVKASRVELLADGLLCAVVVPDYDDDWDAETVTQLNFFGGKTFHRGLIDVPVEIVVTTTDVNMPSIMVGVVTPSLTWDEIGTDYHQEIVTVGSDSGEKTLLLTYHRSGCGFSVPTPEIYAISHNIIN
jgi:hypothetical protein